MICRIEMVSLLFHLIRFVYCICLQCQRLEEQGHDSLVITLSNVGHFVSGSEKGRRYLEERQHLLVDFIQYCAGKNTTMY